jgi:hypothetical protein
MATFNVRMLAYHDDDKIRSVDVPDDLIKGWSDASVLSEIFHFGQNEFQPVERCCSVSVGDVIELNEKFFIVCTMGFKEINRKELDEYQGIPRYRRLFESKLAIW